MNESNMKKILAGLSVAALIGAGVSMTSCASPNGGTSGCSGQKNMEKSNASGCGSSGCSGEKEVKNPEASGCGSSGCSGEKKVKNPEASGCGSSGCSGEKKSAE